ncbi:MAG: hypothetical protein ACC726_04605, partial [Chloroflexota bacterium]
LREVDEILAIGAMVARTLYQTSCPIVVADETAYRAIETGAMVSITPDGSFRITTPSPIPPP